MMTDNWHPDPKIVKQMKEAVRSMGNASSHSIVIGNRFLTWDKLIKEVENGTPLGREYYQSYVEILQSDDI